MDVATFIQSSSLQPDQAKQPHLDVALGAAGVSHDCLRTADGVAQREISVSSMSRCMDWTDTDQRRGGDERPAM